MPAHVETDNVAISKDIYAIISKGDLNQLTNLYAQNSVMVNMPWNTTFRGRDNVLNYIRILRTAFPDMKVTLTHQTAQDDTVVNEWLLKGTHKGVLKSPTGDIAPTNRSVEIPGVSIFEMEDGQVVNIRQYWDINSLLRQIGLVS
ncbi:MAG TPA: ester cyclase [bacterium]|jgi:steroid delta-isomerase-like uncharacterized protein